MVFSELKYSTEQVLYNVVVCLKAAGYRRIPQCTTGTPQDFTVYHRT